MVDIDAIYHESGHAVVAHLVGCTLEHVSVQLNGAERGHTEQSRPPGRYFYRDALTITYAGHAATALRSGTPPPHRNPRAPWSQVMNDRDYLKADAIVRLARRRGNDAEAFKRRCRIRAQRLLSVASHWRAVEAIATALSHRPVIDGAEAHRIIGAALDGDAR